MRFRGLCCNKSFEITNLPTYLYKCDQIGQFLKLMATNYLAKVAKIFNNVLGYFETNTISSDVTKYD